MNALEILLLLIVIPVPAVNASCLLSNAVCKSVWLDIVPCMFPHSADVCVLDIILFVISTLIVII